MSDKTKEIEYRFGEAMAVFGKELGILGMVEGRVFARLVLTRQPLTQDNLMEQVGCSRGNISMAVRTLNENGFIRRVFVKGSRRDYYETNTDLWRITVSAMLGLISRQIDAVHNEFEELLIIGADIKKSDVSNSDLDRIKLLLTQIERLNRYTKGARKLVKTVQKMVEKGL